MRSGRVMRWIGFVALLTLVLASVSPGTMAAQDPESIYCGDSAYCSMSGPSLYVQNTGTGESIFGNSETNGFGVRGKGNPGVYGTSVGAAGVRGVSVNAKGVKGESTNNDGVYGHSVNGTAVNAVSEYGFGVYGEAGDLVGVYGASYGSGSADYGVYGYTESENSTSEAGVYGYNAGDAPGGSGPGVYGFAIADETGYGVRGEANDAHGVYGKSWSTGYAFGGWFSGPAGVYATAEDANADAIIGQCNGGGACYGVNGYSADSIAIIGWTDDANHDWGVWTSDDVSALGYYYSKGLSFFAQNGSDVELQPGDLVVVVGIAAPLPDSDVPVMLVRQADLASASGIVGVVEKAVRFETVTKPGTTYELTEIPDLEGEKVDQVYVRQPGERHFTEPSKVDGPVAPGGAMVLMVQGLVQMKVNASAGAIEPGDLLTAGDGGFARKAQPVTIEGQASLYQAGTLVGKALEPWAEGQGLIWVLVDLR